MLLRPSLSRVSPPFDDCSPEDRLGLVLLDKFELTGIIGVGKHKVVYSAIENHTKIRYSVTASRGIRVDHEQRMSQKTEVRVFPDRTQWPKELPSITKIYAHDCTYEISEFTPQTLPETIVEWQRLLEREARPSNDVIAVMRSYLESPRHTVGWKGLIDDPDIDGAFAINQRLQKAHQLCRDVSRGVAKSGVPMADDVFDCISPHLVSDTLRQELMSLKLNADVQLVNTDAQLRPALSQSEDRTLSIPRVNQEPFYDILSDIPRSTFIHDNKSNVTNPFARALPSPPMAPWPSIAPSPLMAPMTLMAPVVPSPLMAPMARMTPMVPMAPRAPMAPTAVGSADFTEEPPLYVNAKQFHRILKRRIERSRIEGSELERHHKFPKMEYKVKQGLPGFVNGREVSALPDTGSRMNVVSEAFAEKLGLSITGSSSIFKLGNSRKTKSVGVSPPRSS